MAAICLIAREMFNALNLSYPNEPLNFKKLLVISLGVGTAKQEHKYNVAAAARWGSLEWLLGNGSTPLLDILLQAPADMVDFHTSIFFQTCRCEANYLRIQYDKLEGVAASVDNSTKENLDNLVSIGKKLLMEDVSRVNIANGKIVPVLNGGTNGEALARFAKILSDEKTLREAST